MSFDFDLFVIGGGSGGVRAARVAALPILAQKWVWLRKVATVARV